MEEMGSFCSEARSQCDILQVKIKFSKILEKQLKKNKKKTCSLV
jgi:hypothetical protein